MTVDEKIRILRTALATIPRDWIPAGHDDMCGCALCGVAKGIARDADQVLEDTR